MEIKCSMCNLPARRVALFGADFPWVSEIEWYDGLSLTSKEYFNTNGNEIVFGCSKEHLEKAIIKYKLIQKLKGK